MGCTQSDCNNLTNNQEYKYDPSKSDKVKKITLLRDSNRQNHTAITTFSQGIHMLKIQLCQNKQDSGFISQQVWEFVLAKFEKYSLNITEKLEFIDFIGKILQYDFQTENSQRQQEFCIQVSQNLHRLESRLFFNHKHCIQYLKYVSSNDSDQSFSKLKFNMSSEEIQKVASKVRVFCNHNIDTFSFLTLYLQISLKNLTAKTETDALAESFVDKIKDLQKIYPASNIELEINNQGHSLENIIFGQKYEILTFQKNQISHYEQLQDFILQKAKMASQDLDLFKSIVKNACYERGYGFKYGLKIKHQEQNIAAIFRVVQKLMDKKIYEQKFVEEKQKYQSQRLKWTRSRSLEEKVNDQIKQVEKRIKRILQDQQQIQFDSKDLVRAKCIFNNVDDVLQTVKLLTKRIKTAQDCKVFQLKNRLGKNTKDVTLIIKLPHSIAQLQLVLKLDLVANQFNHKIYEIIRSNMYSPITCLFIHNKKWGQAFFSQQIQIFNNAMKLEPDRDYGENVKFQDLKADVSQFQSEFLKKNFKAQTQHDRQQKNEDACQKIKQMIVKIKVKSQIQNKQRDQTHQLQNGIKFYKSFHNNQMALKNSDALLKLENQFNPQSQKVAEIYKNSAEIHKDKGEYEKAIQFFQKSHNIYQKMFGKQHILTATSYNDIGTVYDSKGDYKKSLEFFYKSLKIYQQVLGKQDISTATIYNNIGGVYIKKGKYEKALEFFYKSLNIQQKLLGKQDVSTAASYNNIGSVYIKKGEYQKALEFLLKSLNIQQKVLGKQDVSTAGSYNNIGSVYNRKGEYQKALEFYLKSLNIRQKVLGKQDISTAATYNDIGTVYDNTGEYEKSLEFYLKSLSIRQKVLGKQDISTAASYNGIGAVFDSKGEYEKSLEFYLKSLKIKQKVLGKQDVSTATSYNNLGSLYTKKGEYEKALDFLLKSLQIQQKVLGKQDISTAGSYHNIGSLYKKKGEYEMALEFYLKSLKIQQKVLGKQNVSTATSYHNISCVYSALQRIDEAYQFVKKAYQVRNLNLGSQHRNTKDSLMQLEKLKKKLNK